MFYEIDKGNENIILTIYFKNTDDYISFIYYLYSLKVNYK